MVNSPFLAVRAAVDGLGVAYTIEALAEPFLRSGQLVRVLEDWSPAIEGLFLYYPGHRQVPAALRALIDMIRSARGSAQGLTPQSVRGGPSASRLRRAESLGRSVAPDRPRAD
jgi:DNA-binding transcriptional LysR family regulator